MRRNGLMNSENNSDCFEELSCENCGQCKCFSCKHREREVSGSYGDCNRCDMGCEDIPVTDCDDFEYTDY